MNCDPQNPDCSLEKCHSNCGIIRWFGNLSQCPVTLQYQDRPGGLWHSLGTYGPGQTIELGSGAIYLPSNSNIRAIHAEDPKLNRPPQVVTDWGRIGQGMASLSVDDAGGCQTTQTSATPILSPPVSAPPIKVGHVTVNKFIIVFLTFVTGAAVWTAWKVRADARK